MQQVAERVEEADVIESSRIGDVVKEKFISLVEGRFLQRVKPIDHPLVVATHGAEEAGGITKMSLNLKFDLPPAVDGMYFQLFDASVNMLCLMFFPLPLARSGDEAIVNYTYA